MGSRHQTGWDKLYHRYPPKSLPWELGKPRKVLLKLLDSGKVKPCKTLDLCCGAGTNPVYLATKGFEVIALDISDGAVKYAKDKARKAKVGMDFLVGDFLNLPFRNEEFDFAFDFGCFHHVDVDDRTVFIDGVHRILKPDSRYSLVCFSDKNGPAWNHFTKEQIVDLFTDYFEIERVSHVSSLEGDNVTRYFYEVLMKKPS